MNYNNIESLASDLKKKMMHIKNLTVLIVSHASNNGEIAMKG